MLLENVLAQVNGSNNMSNQTLAEDVLDYMEISTTLSEQTMAFQIATRFLNESEDGDKSKTLWKKIKGTLKIWFEKFKHMVVKMFAFIKQKLSQGWNYIKNSVVDTEEAEVIAPADYERLITVGISTFKLTENFAKHARSDSHAEDLRKEAGEKVQALAELYAATKAKRKLQKINKSQASAYIKLIEKLRAYEDVAKTVTAIITAMPENAKPSEGTAASSLLHKNASFLTSFAGEISKDFNKIAHKFKMNSRSEVDGSDTGIKATKS